MFSNIQTGLPSPVANIDLFDTLKWYDSPNGSIYIKYLQPKYEKEHLHALFSFIGQINRIDIVNSPPKPNGAFYRMAFIHYDYWFSNIDSINCRKDIISYYPEPIQMRDNITMPYSETDPNTITFTINTRPVPKTDYNIDQLSDMYHRLREEYTVSVENHTALINDLRSEVEDLRRNQAAEIQKEVLRILNEIKPNMLKEVNDRVESAESDISVTWKELTLFQDFTKQTFDDVFSEIDELKDDIPRNNSSA